MPSQRSKGSLIPSQGSGFRIPDSRSIPFGPGPESGPEPGPESGHEPGPESGPKPGPEPGLEPGPEHGSEPGPKPGPEPGPEPDERIGIVMTSTERHTSTHLIILPPKLHSIIIKSAVDESVVAEDRSCTLL
eukprot:scpid107856/ scgid11013/ 